MQHRAFQRLSLICVLALCSAAAFAAGQTATVHKPTVDVHGAADLEVAHRGHAQAR